MGGTLGFIVVAMITIRKKINIVAIEGVLSIRIGAIKIPINKIL